MQRVENFAFDGQLVSFCHFDQFEIFRRFVNQQCFDAMTRWMVTILKKRKIRSNNINKFDNIWIPWLFCQTKLSRSLENFLQDNALFLQKNARFLQEISVSCKNLERNFWINEILARYVWFLEHFYFFIKPFWRSRYLSKFHVFLYKNVERIKQSIQTQAFRVGSEIDKNDLIQKDEKR